MEQDSTPLVQEHSPKKTVRIYKVALFTGLLFVVIVLGVFLLLNRKTSSKNQSPSITPSQTPKITEVISTPTMQLNVLDAQNRLLFIRDPDPQAYNDYQAWVLYPDGREEQIELPTFSQAFKYPHSAQVFFITPNDNSKLFVKNIITNTIKEYTLIKHPEPNTHSNTDIQNVKNISPDGSYIVFSTYFTVDCPPITFPPDFEGGYGPCEPSPAPDFTSGYYFHHMQTQKNIYLADFIYGIKWDLDKKILYYVDNTFQKTGLNTISLATGEIKQIDAAKYFGYSAYPLSTSNILIKTEGSTGDTPGTTSFSRVVISNLDTDEEMILDEGKWADIQPFIAISPDEKYFMYERTAHIDGFQYGSLNLVSLTDKSVRQITPSSNAVSYDARGVWTNNDTFVTLVYTMPDGINANNYLVSINIQTGEIKKLTPENVLSF